MSNKIIVGVHGIGDQTKYETIQAIARQFCRHYDIPVAVPLGSFHNKKNILTVDGKNEKLYFTEAYWADIARKPETEGYTLEETKGWAKTIVKRLEIQSDEAKEKDIDYRMVRSVLYGAIDTVDIMERLTWLADRAGIFKFNLKHILTHFLGDVQIVTEFESYREDILDRFYSALKDVHTKDKEADIYIVAHSEGTVIAFLGLLKALQNASKTEYQWIKRVKGFMTIGSPIDKHIILWPKLWDDFKPVTTEIKKDQIRWRNYYDLGDPVGYELNSARELLKKNKCDAFQFEDKGHDHGFSRYYLPGKAHVEYWKDKEVFNHFITDVVKDSEIKPPKNNLLAKVTDFVAPYTAVYAVTFAAVYFLYKAIEESVNPSSPVPVGKTAWDIGGIAAILSGMTVMARIPRLSRKNMDYLLGGVVFICAILIYWWMTSQTISDLISEAILACPSMRDLLKPFAQSGREFLYAMSVPVAASTVVIIAGMAARKWSSARTIPLNIVGGFAVMGIAATIVMQEQTEPALWPLFIGGALFLYLWWLSILFFDLVFVWRKYIRRSWAVKKMREIQKN